MPDTDAEANKDDVTTREELSETDALISDCTTQLSEASDGSEPVRCDIIKPGGKSL